MNTAYTKFDKAMASMGEALIEINGLENKPLKLLVSKLVDKLGFNDPGLGDDIAMIRWAVANDDESLEKLTAKVTGGKLANSVVSEPDGKPDGEQDAADGTMS